MFSAEKPNSSSLDNKLFISALRNKALLGIQPQFKQIPPRDSFSIIALDFPIFKDGRSYSHARLLRERYNYKGELRAVGDVLQDQLFFMERCGIDSFQIRDDKDIEQALNGLKGFSVRYQAAADDTIPISERRKFK